MNKRQLLIEKEKIFKNYQDYWGFLDHCKKDPGQTNASGNGMLYMSQAMVLFVHLGILDLDDITHYIRTINTARLKSHKGIYHRHPLLNNHLEEHDNQMGMVVALHFLRRYLISLGHNPKADTLYGKVTELLNDVYEFGQSRKKFGFYFYNNLEPDKRTLQTLRQGCYRTIIDNSAGKEPRTLDLIWSVGNAYYSRLSLHKEGNVNSGVRLMGWTILQGLIGRSHFWNDIEHAYTKKAKINEMATIYYGNTPWAVLFNEYYRRKYNVWKRN